VQPLSGTPTRRREVRIDGEEEGGEEEEVTR
jgi:hypothetical protein